MPDVGIFVPAVAVSNPNLCPLDKLVFGEIVALSAQTGFCFAINAHFANRHSVSTKTIQRSISNLQKCGLVRVEFEAGHSSRRIFPINAPDKPVLPSDNIVLPAQTDLSQTSDIDVRQEYTIKSKRKARILALHKHGEFGWVKLTDEQHKRLVEEYGEATITRAITYVDESAQSTGNKNRWKDWNLVLRKCIRNGWGGITPPTAKPDFKIVGGVKIYG